MKLINLVFIIGLLSYVYSIKIKSKKSKLKSKSKQYYNGNPAYSNGNENVPQQQPVTNYGYPQQQVQPQNYAGNQMSPNMSQRAFNNAIDVTRSQMDHPIQISNVI